MTFLERMWAYVTLGATGSFVGEASPLFGGLAAFNRNLGLLSVIAAVALGTWLGGFLFYGVGRSRSRWIRKRWPRLRPMILRSVMIVRRHPWRASLGTRFAYGLRIALPLACGVARLPLIVYAIGTGVSCIVWSVVFTVLGWGLGRTTETLVEHVKQWERIIGATFILLMLLGFLIAKRRRVADRTVRVLDPEP